MISLLCTELLSTPRHATAQAGECLQVMNAPKAHNHHQNVTHKSVTINAVLCIPVCG